MAEGNDFFQRMCKEAQEDLASGEKGTWRDIETNTLLLACFGFLTNHLTHQLSHRLSKLLWVFAGSVLVGMIGYIINMVVSGG